MLLVKTKIGPSVIAGTGLFAEEPITKGTLIWKFYDGVDESFSLEEVEALPEPKRSDILSLKHAYISMKTGCYINCGDNAKYINHSDNPNIISVFDDTSEVDNSIAARGIAIGEELTLDYRSFAQEGIDFQEVNYT